MLTYTAPRRDGCQHPAVATSRALFETSPVVLLAPPDDPAAQVAAGRRIVPIVCVQNQYNLAHRGDDALIDQLFL